ncbi:MAG: tetratricopeptide repeat protein [Planctomycetes bacterium]|nr:tetratricopeptide repeat protein [Planctomycetota bacterium]
MPFAENAYLFRHAMMRLAAYDLQPPFERAALHAHAFSILEALPQDDPDALAYELAGHARDALFGDPDPRRRTEMHEHELRWLTRAMPRARNHSNFRIALECAERILANPSAVIAQRHEAALQAAEMSASLGEFNRVPEFLSRAGDMHSDECPELRGAWILSSVNGVHLPQREYDTAIILLREALELYRRSGDRMGEARATGYIGNVLARLDQRDKAVEQYERAEGIFRELNHLRGLSTCRGNLGLMYRYFDDNDKAESAYREALQIDREIGNREGVPRHIGNLGVLYRDTGRLNDALGLFDEAGDLFHELGDRTGWMRNAINHATCFELLGQLHRAVTLYQQAERVAHECGLVHDAADCISYRGQVLLKLKDTVRGEPILAEAAARYETLGTPDAAAATWETLAGSAHARNEPEAALRCASAALQNHTAAKTAPGFKLLALHAEVALAHDQFADAARSAGAALKVAPTDTDPIQMATLKAIAKKGQASSAT